MSYELGPTGNRAFFVSRWALVGHWLGTVCRMVADLSSDGHRAWAPVGHGMRLTHRLPPARRVNRTPADGVRYYHLICGQRIWRRSWGETSRLADNIQAHKLAKLTGRRNAKRIVS